MKKKAPVLKSASVTVLREAVVLPTYLPLPPEKNPMFLERRVYQGSSGCLYPLPFTDRIASEPVNHAWQGIWLENEYLRALILPEIGGRIHLLQDKTNGYDLVYHQEVIKPALVGLAGPWISGGIEFNWAQHHRPGTFLPTEVEIEEDPDGSITVWCGDTDPLCRMRAIHGVCLRPGVARLEVRVRAYNRTTLPQTFLWWANVATEVHEAYQSFFPPDVFYIADHAKRATSRFPLCDGHYYGVDYGERARSGVPPQEAPARSIPPASGGASPVDYPANDLSFYANIPVPTSYMAMGSREDFFGGYDHHRQAGLLHLANHHIAPGKKQWTWGNHEFGYAWDRNLTDPNRRGECPPYIELMAGVYTDNQPDFSFLQPGETKTWTQFWAPLTHIGPAHHATADAALSLVLLPGKKRRVRLGVVVFTGHEDLRFCVLAKGKLLAEGCRSVAPGRPLLEIIDLPPRIERTDLHIRVETSAGRVLLAWQPAKSPEAEVPPSATEPPPPGEVGSIDELYLTGLHLSQYRHATRAAEPYWQEGLRRDPGDSRCHTALAAWHLRRGEWSTAETHARAALARLTHRNPNPADGEPYYLLGLILRHQGRAEDAYAAFYKATWNQAWAAASYHALAEIDGTRQDWDKARDHLVRSLQGHTENLRARNLLTMVWTRLGECEQAARCLQENCGRDALDPWSRYLAGNSALGDAQDHLDLAHDLARAGFLAEAIAVLECTPPPRSTLPDQTWGTAPLVAYTLGWLWHRSGDPARAAQEIRRAGALDPSWCFPARLEEIEILTLARELHPTEARAPYYLGNLLYAYRRHEEALVCWEEATRLDPTLATAWRNLGLGSYNVRRRPRAARAAYAKAVAAAPRDARLLYEQDQLWKRLGLAPQRRLRELLRHPDLVARRDDLTLEVVALFNQTGQPQRAHALLVSRPFQPWEGGEGQVLGQYGRTCLLLARRALAEGRPNEAIERVQEALAPPSNLGEARHLLANQSDLYFWLGECRAAAGDLAGAREAWQKAAESRGDFQEMSVRSFSEMTYYSALAWQRLGEKVRAKKLLRELLAYAKDLEKQPARIDYFATSLPTMLIFHSDLQAAQSLSARFLQAQALLGLGRRSEGRALLEAVLGEDPSHALAEDLLRETLRR